MSHRLTALVLLLGLAIASSLRCWRCGQYSDGVGSITPCTNHTGAKLGECQSDARYCIKYVSELTTVRDCVPTCTEKDWWGARTYCCNTDECNASIGPPAASVVATLVAPLFAALIAR